MKNKKISYILITAVVLIWGLIIFRMINYSKKDIPLSQISEKKINKLKENESLKDTFSIVANYPDPFSGNLIEKKKDKPIIQSKKKDGESKNILWPSIRYSGLILNKKTNKMVSIIKINNKEYLMHPGDTILNIILIKMFKDSVFLKLENDKKTIIKN